MRIEDKANINQQIEAQQKASDDLLKESGVSGSAPEDAEKKAELGQAVDFQNIVAKLIENAELSSENKESGVEKLEKATEQSFNQADKGESWQNYAETNEAKSLPASVEDIKAQEKNEESAKEEQVRAQEMLAQLTIQSGKIPG